MKLYFDGYLGWWLVLFRDDVLNERNVLFFFNLYRILKIGYDK